MQPEKKGTIKDLVLYRLDTAKNDIRAAKALFGIEEYKGANNRAYYSIFHSFLAIHALFGKSNHNSRGSVGVDF